MDPVGNTSDEFRKMLANDIKRWKPVIEKMASPYQIDIR
jgi:hypothetical protein